MKIKREPAWRIFGAELNRSKKVLKKEGEKEVPYLLTPLGAKVRRVFMVGALTNIIPGETDEDFTRAELSDGTSNIFIKASKYNERAKKKLDTITIPALIALSGKVSVYAPTPENFFISIIPETISITDKNVRNYWILTTSEFMKIRIDALNEAQKMQEPTVKMLQDLGYTRVVAENTILALKEYGHVDIEGYINIVETALKSIAPSFSEVQLEFPELEEVDENKELEYENKILELIEKYDFEGKGAKYDDLRETCKKEKIPFDKLDEILETLENNGIIYQPTFGYIKKV